MEGWWCLKLGVFYGREYSKKKGLHRGEVDFQGKVGGRQSQKLGLKVVSEIRVLRGREWF